MNHTATALLLLRQSLRTPPPCRRAISSLSSLFLHPMAGAKAAEEDARNLSRWKEKEEEILRDIKPTVTLAQRILHSGRYKDGEYLSPECAKEVVEKLLVHHPNCNDKIGGGLDAVHIMVDHHPNFKNSRCMFVVKTDGCHVDFSYWKCLKAYILRTYPEDAERFLKSGILG